MALRSRRYSRPSPRRSDGRLTVPPVPSPAESLRARVPPVGAPAARNGILPFPPLRLPRMSQPLGVLCVILHGHQPYVLHHGDWPHGEAWLYEAAAESYLPLLDVIEDA